MNIHPVSRGAIVGSGWRRPQVLLAVGALPTALLVRGLAFRFPGIVDAVYTRGVYPRIVRLQGLLFGWTGVAVVEVLTPVTILLVGWLSWRFLRRGPLRRRLLVAALGLWGLAGAVAWLFLLLWGFNYARPPLATRLQLEPAGQITAEEVLALGRRLGVAAASSRARLAAPSDEADATPVPLPSPLTFGELESEVDEALRALGLPGDPFGSAPLPAKPLVVSALLARLGISGIYVPFTGEPVVNRLIPDPALPLVLAHEKAHQRGVTDEGEANLVAVLACLRARHPYVRYAAQLDAAARLIGAGSVGVSEEEAVAAWHVLGPGAIGDLRAIREFWDSYRGVATEVAGRVNDAYLRSNRVPGGVRSYGRVVQLLVAAERGRWLTVQ